MSRNGSGIYSLATGNPVITGTTISSTWANGTLIDIASALTTSIASDGQTVISANIPLNNNKITGLAAPTTTGDALSFGNVATISTLTATSVNTPNTFGFKNRIINGAMQIDQRNAGASLTAPASVGYSLDRWATSSTNGSKYTVQQTPSATETGYAVRVAAGFTNYLAVTSSAATTIAAGDTYSVRQYIEGFNTADLGFGTASAATVTISFWVYSSLTGAFGAVFWDGVAGTSFYPFSYSIPVANTWTKITITIAGRTSGTWATNNTTGACIQFMLGTGSTYLGTGNAWTSSVILAPTGSTNVLATNGATFYITGVQLEKGSTATSFDYRPYGSELALCQRYFEILRGGGEVAAVAMGVSSTSSFGLIKFAVTKRAAPTMASSTTASNFVIYTGGGSINASAVPTYSINSAIPTVNSSPVLYATAGSIVANQSLILMILGSSSDFISASSEL